MKKIVIITGANSGIGKAAAVRFAAEGWQVVMACRSLDRAAAAREEIVRASGSDAVDMMELDMSSRGSIQAFAAAFEREYPRLDVLIHNAAYFNHGEDFRLNEDGVEVAFATNVAGPYLLTHLLLDSLRRSDDPRVLNAGSNIIKHFFSPRKAVEFGHLYGVAGGGKAPNVYERYCQTKMALLMLTFAMARKLKADGIAVNCLQINGARMSKETLHKFTWPYRLVALLQNLFFRPTDYMANNYFEITTAERFRGVSGKNINDKLRVMSSASNENAGPAQQIKQVLGSTYYPSYADDVEVQEQIWSVCEALAEPAREAGPHTSSEPLAR